MRTQPLVLSLLVSLSPSLCHALPTAANYDVLLEGQPVGVLGFRSRVGDDGAAACHYTGHWTSLNVPFTRTVSCRLLEYKAGDSFDCEQNHRAAFSTIMTADAPGCAGFDSLGQYTRLTTLIAGEFPDGHLSGVAVTASIGDVQELEVLPRTQVPTRMSGVTHPSAP